MSLLLLAMFSLYAKGYTQLKLASIFTDNMVLQQQSKDAIWGWASPGKTISVKPSWNKKTATAKTDASGRRKAFVETPVAGGPFDILLSGNGSPR
jgi:sialate O-acetylesterase